MINFIISTVVGTCKNLFPNNTVEFVRDGTKSKTYFRPSFLIKVDGKLTDVFLDTTLLNEAIEQSFEAPVTIIRSLINEIGAKILAEQNAPQ
jgi:hypothetical protein